MLYSSLALPQIVLLSSSSFFSELPNHASCCQHLHATEPVEEFDLWVFD